MKIKIVSNGEPFIYEANLIDIDKGFMICYNEEVDAQVIKNEIIVLDDKITVKKTGAINSLLEFSLNKETEGFIEIGGFRLFARVIAKNILKMDGIISINYDIIIEDKENKEIIIYY